MKKKPVILRILVGFAVIVVVFLIIVATRPADMAKAMCMFMNMDKMVGGQFEKGLADLKSAAEAGK